MPRLKINCNCTTSRSDLIISYRYIINYFKLRNCSSSSINIFIYNTTHGSNLIPVLTNATTKLAKQSKLFKHIEYSFNIIWS